VLDPVILGGHFIKGESACLTRPIQWFGRCSFRCACTTLWQQGGGDVPSLHAYLSALTFFVHTDFLKVFTSFAKTLYLHNVSLQSNNKMYFSWWVSALSLWAGGHRTEFYQSQHFCFIAWNCKQAICNIIILFVRRTYY
jgi:hypothetical protein